MGAGGGVTDRCLCSKHQSSFQNTAADDEGQDKMGFSVETHFLILSLRMWFEPGYTVLCLNTDARLIPECLFRSSTVVKFGSTSRRGSHTHTTQHPTGGYDA